MVEDNPDDAALGLPRHALDLLREFPFYDRIWSPTVAQVINRYFQVFVTPFYYPPFSAAVGQFEGTVVARAFGLAGVGTYDSLINEWKDERVKKNADRMGERLVFGQGYDNLSEIEPPLFARRAVTLPLPLPSWMRPAANTWNGKAGHALFFCPIITGSSYYRAIYDSIKSHFGDLPHRIFGKQSGPIDDTSVLKELSDEALRSLYAESRVLVYPSSEQRHVHYAPLEAMMVGAPVLYLRGTLLDREAGIDLPGACADLKEMHRKAADLLNGDSELSESIRTAQSQILLRFSDDAALSAWRGVLDAIPSRRGD